VSSNSVEFLSLKIDGNDKSYYQLYSQKVLNRFYRRKISNRFLDLSREECDKQFGIGDFFNLNFHTKFSILSGVDDPNDVFEAVSKVGMKGLAITENGYLSSIPNCFNAAKSSKLKYVAGIYAYFSDWEVSRRKIDPKDIKNHPALINNCKVFRTPNITILAKNQAGYKELLNLNSESWKDGYYYVPKVSRQMLKKYANGNLIILSGTLLDQFIDMGYIMSNGLSEYDALGAYEYIKWFDKVFGDDFYVEMVMRCQDNVWGSDLDKLITIFGLLDNYKNECGKVINTVVTNDVRYVDRDSKSLYRAVIAISRNTVLKKIKDYSSELYLKTRSELRGTFHRCLYSRFIPEKMFEESCDRSLIIADACDNFKPDLSPKLPEIDNADEILRNKVMEALIKSKLNYDVNKYEVDGNMVTYTEQAEIELNRIIEKKFSSYFLIMEDIIKFSHDSGWETGPGRGSSAGSLICFLLNITSIDPIRFKLSFDRMLSNARGGYLLKVTMD